jgi:signal transduction histidine kinase
VSRGSQGVQTYPISDSTAETKIEDIDFTVALDAARTGRTATGTEPTNEGRVGEAARPLFFNDRVARVVVFSAPLGDVQGNVALIRRQIAIAGAFALLFASLAGYLVARALSRRIKRLETAADKVAGGDFSERIPIDGDDELSDLARAFNDMQRQLAQLDSARKRFIAVASHELRTPIFSLGGFVELLQDEELDEGDPPPVPRPDGRPDRAAAEARDGAARPLEARGRLARAAARADRRGRAGAAGHGRVHAGAGPATTPTSSCVSSATRSGPPATVSGWRRSCES